MILLIDNYDSFVFNLSRAFREMGCETIVKRNDAFSLADLDSLELEAVVISPGPCTPSEAGLSLELIRTLNSEIPILGVCLGHQCLAAAYGTKIVRAPEPVHGRTSPIQHDDSPLFSGVSNPFTATRYHSLIVDEATLPAEFRVNARGPGNLPMAVQHVSRPLFGVQFHPESILTSEGGRILRNFLSISGCEITGEPVTEWKGFTHDKVETPPDLPLHW
ncbi:MAG: aminodeoxychorismate synthase component 2 [Planctomycetaceae bacterium]